MGQKMQHQLCKWLLSLAFVAGGLLSLQGAAQAQDRSVHVFIDQMSAQKTTEDSCSLFFFCNDRDEIFIMVSGQKHDVKGNPIEIIQTRLPQPDDYYEFWTNNLHTDVWTNKDQKNVGRPSLLNDTLAPGQSINAMILMAEQDNKQLHGFRALANTALDIASQAEPQYKSFFDKARELVDLIPDNSKDDVIGAFNVQVANKNGTIEFAVIPVITTALGTMNNPLGNIDHRMIASGKATTVGMDMHGTSESDYDVIVKVSVGSISCYDTVQGHIAWDYNGSKEWDPSNVKRLCAGAESSREPALCFDHVMHGGVNWGGGTRWAWQNALDLCEGTLDAAGTISCFETSIARGSQWPNAIAACDERT